MCDAMIMIVQALGSISSYLPTTIAISDGPEKEEERKEKMGYASCSRDKLVSFAGFASVVDFYIRK